MFEARHTKNTNGSWRIQNTKFFLQRSEKSMSLEEFLELANKLHFEKYGFEANYVSREVHTKAKHAPDPYTVIIRGRWASLNQRSSNGKYNKAKSINNNPQQLSYLKKDIKVEMTKQEFFDWMWQNKAKHDKITSAGERSSINRIDPRKGYSLDNIELVSLHNNIEEKFGFECRYMSEVELAEKSILNALRYQEYQAKGVK